MVQYQWGVKITLEYLNDDGTVAHTETQLRECLSENIAKARYEAAADTIAYRESHPEYRPNYQRITAAELIRRPVGQWETAA